MPGPQWTRRFGTRVGRYPNHIREYRLSAGLTQRQLAGLLRIERSTVSVWERGHRLPGRLTKTLALARDLNTLIESLYFEMYRAGQRRLERRRDRNEGAIGTSSSGCGA